MPDTATSAVVAGGALAKYLGLHMCAGMLAAGLGFLVLWPRTVREGFTRIVITLMASSIFGPVLVIWVHEREPELFDSAREVASLNGLDAAFGILFVSTPLLVVAGLPAWWVVGAVVRWFDTRREMDVVELASDLAQDVAGVARNVTRIKKGE